GRWQRNLDAEILDRAALPAKVEQGFSFTSRPFYRDVLDEQTEHPLAVLAGSRGALPELGQVFGQRQQLALLFFGQFQALLLPLPVEFFLGGRFFLEGLVPALLQ